MGKNQRDKTRELAVFMHNKLCGWNHADGCGWLWEEEHDNDGKLLEKTWGLHAHSSWCQKAERALSITDEKTIKKLIESGLWVA